MKTISDKDLPITIPRDVAVCPKCDSDLTLENVDVYLPDGSLDEESEISFNCVTEPDIDNSKQDWPDWHRWHWSTPYIDWLPLEPAVRDWFNENYRMGEDVEEKLKAWNESSAKP